MEPECHKVREPECLKVSEPKCRKISYSDNEFPKGKELFFRSESCSKDGSKTSKQTDKPPADPYVSCWSILAILISICLPIIDNLMDIYLVYHYYNLGRSLYVILAGICILFPVFVYTAVSIRLYMLDNTEPSSTTSRVIRTCKISWIFVFIFQLAIILRHCDSLYYALKSRKAEKRKDHANQCKYYELLLKEVSDVALLLVLEGFLEDAPQLVIQVVIVLFWRDEDFSSDFQAVPSIVLLVSMTWSMASYHRSIRLAQEHKKNMSWSAIAIHFLWHLMITVSRIVSISAVASVLPYWTFAASALHWFMMTAWLAIFERTRVLKDASIQIIEPIVELLLCAAIGLVYIFTYLTPVEGKTRNRYLVYYSLCFLENTTGIILWSFMADSNIKNSWYYVPLMFASVVPFLIGIIFMVIYYTYFHPVTAQKSCPKMHCSRMEIR